MTDIALASQEKLYTDMQYHLRWRIDECQEDSEHVFGREEDLLEFINNSTLRFPDAVFEVFYGRKVKLKSKLVIASYELERP